MNKINYEDFLEAAKKLVDEQYGEEVEEDFFTINEKLNRLKIERGKKKKDDPDVNLSEASPNDIKKTLSSSTVHFRIGPFLIKRLNPPVHGSNIKIMEERNKIWCAVNIVKDKRFQEAPWKTSFGGMTALGRAISEEILFDIVRWLQVIDRMGIIF